MFKKIKMGLLISCVSVSSYAYVIDSNLIVENKTELPLQIIVDQPNGQDPSTMQILAHQTNQMPISNGDSSGWLYQTSTAPFKIIGMDDNKLYVHGRVAFYVGASMWNKYSFLNTITAADGLNVNPTYFCTNGGYGVTLENKMVIEGTPGNELQVTRFPEVVNCQGLKSSELTHENQYYTATCYDGRVSKFWRYYDGTVCRHHGHGCTLIFGYTNGEKDYGVEHTEEPTALHDALDRRVGNNYCDTWGNKF